MGGRRLFVGVPVARPARRVVEEVITDLKRDCPAGVRWSLSEDLHVTLVYLGEVDESRIDAIVQAVAASVGDTARFEAAVRGIRAFPNEETPSVVWIGFDDEGDVALHALQRPVATAMAGLGFELDARPFVPHITIGRLSGRRPTALVAQAIRPHRNRDLGSLVVTELALYVSETAADAEASGSRYRIVATFPLQ